jgi:hypothetical protein
MDVGQFKVLAELSGIGGGADPFNFSAATKPNITGFTLLQNTNLAGTASIANLPSGRGFVLNVPCTSYGNDNVAWATKPVPSGSWTLQAMLCVNQSFYKAYSSAGLCVVDTAGKALTFTCSTFSGNNTPQNSIVIEFATINEYWSNIPMDGALTPGVPVWMQLAYNGTAYTFSVSMDGETWTERYTTPATQYLTTPASFGIACNANAQGSGTGTAGGTAVTVFSFNH